jgi:GNAT superfamily N-acetyltransferase
MSRVEVREADERDLPGVLRIYSQPGLDDGEGFSEEEARAHFARFRGYPDYRLYVAVADGEIVGTFALLIMDNLAHRGARSAVVEDVAVLPDRQGQGIGKAMMAFALQRCREAGCYKMALSSNLKRGPAHAFYDALGFERHGYSFVIRP